MAEQSNSDEAVHGIQIDLHNVPIWARVALAAQCVRYVAEDQRNDNSAALYVWKELDKVVRTGFAEADYRLLKDVAVKTYRSGDDDAVDIMVDAVHAYAVAIQAAQSFSEAKDPSTLETVRAVAKEEARKQSLELSGRVLETTNKLLRRNPGFQRHVIADAKAVAAIKIGWLDPVPATLFASPRVNEPAAALVDLYIDPGSATKEDLQELFESLSELHVAHGGDGLVFRRNDDTVFVMAGEEVH